MKVKLSYKIFITFLLASLMSVVFMVLIMQIYVSRNFADYVNKAEMKNLGDLVNALSVEYKKNQGWDHLKHNSNLWVEVLRSVAFKNGSIWPFFPPSSPHHPFEGRGEKWPPHLSPFDGRGERFPPHPPSEEREGREGKWPPHPPFNERRISLFDNEKHLIAGHAASTEDHILREIIVDGKRVGWLGLKKRKPLSNQLEVDFLYRQSKAFLIIGCGVLFLAVLVSFLLSRHLLKPIQQLTEGARALTLRKFGTRIGIHSADELGQLASDFNEMAQTLEKYERMRQQWIVDIAHELRTPLAVLRGEIEAIQDGVRDMSRETLDSLHVEVMLLSKIVNDLHELSILDTRTLSHQKEPLNPLHVLRDMLKIFKPRFIKEHITVQDDLGHDHNITVMGDSDRLAQVFSNIMENTLRYTDSPGVLRISQYQAGADLYLNFEDSAPGVPEDTLDRLFDRLFRVDKSRSREKGGNGLGLAICKSIIEEMFGGKVKAAHSSLGGLRIEIKLPLNLHTQ